MRKCESEEGPVAVDGGGTFGNQACARSYRSYGFPTDNYVPTSPMVPAGVSHRFLTTSGLS